MTGAWLRCDGAALMADPSGALVWPEQALVVVADLHFEKGSSLARRGTLLPPYDTRATLTRLEQVLARWQPRRVISLGDGFHDPAASERLATSDRRRLAALTDACEWLWLAGNHDPGPPQGVGGRVEAAVEIDGVVFRHLPAGSSSGAEVAGHLHPKARVAARARSVSRPCFVGDGTRLLLPAFGSYTGGLDVLDPAIAGLFADGFNVGLLGDGKVHSVSHQRLRELAAPRP